MTGTSGRDFELRGIGLLGIGVVQSLARMHNAFLECLHWHDSEVQVPKEVCPTAGRWLYKYARAVVILVMIGLFFVDSDL